MEALNDDRSPNPVDVHVGDRIRRRRRALGISQDKLAEALGLTFQQVQKYERGANRVSASKLYQVAHALHAPIPYFFDGLPDPAQNKDVEPVEPATFVRELPLTPEEREFATWLSQIESRRVRKRLLDLVRTLADTEGSAETTSEG
ncbi:helix-turn-helix domain-containing protein [Caulobacter sp. S45]|jgi:transcriptional regulator with XRE-family HTH domain|uniref:helix-turn-helix domain-containing protein n=1 Tax=Caulobacter sp. S45 TaxID=1641861 RepID=UPI00131DABA5|nr:helix-turn-helix transcriptional regulator [Caulobacter sp. S45]